MWVPCSAVCRLARAAVRALVRGGSLHTRRGGARLTHTLKQCWQVQGGGGGGGTQRMNDMKQRGGTRGGAARKNVGSGQGVFAVMGCGEVCLGGEE